MFDTEDMCSMCGEIEVIKKGNMLSIVVYWIADEVQAASSC